MQHVNESKADYALLLGDYTEEFGSDADLTTEENLLGMRNR